MYSLTTNNNATLATTKDLESLIERFISFTATTQRTAESYRANIQRFCQWLKAHDITKPTREDVIAYRQMLIDTGKKATTIHAYLAAVKVFFDFLEDEGLYTNIARRVKCVHIDKGFKRDYLTAANCEKTLSSIDTTTLEGKRNFAIFSLLFSTGLRVIELNRATIADINTLGGETVLYIQGKGRTDKSVYVKLEPFVQQAIKDYFSARGAKDVTEPLFTSTSNRAKNCSLSTHTLSVLVKKMLQGAGFDSPRLTAHSLRHSNGTIATQNGLSVEQTQMQLRHSNINTTMNYIHAVERENLHAEKTVLSAVLSQNPTKWGKWL